MTTAPPQPNIRLHDFALAAGAAFICLSVWIWLLPTPPAPKADAMAYIEWAAGVTDHGVFGPVRDVAVAPTPQNDFAPLYPAFLALLMSLDDAMHQGLVCLLERSARSSCELSFTTILLAQTLLMSVFLACCWAIAFLLTSARPIAWTALVVALASAIPVEYARLHLTEALTLPLFALFTLFLLLTVQRKTQWHWPVLAGAALGLLALTKPSFLYLFYFLLVLGAASLILIRNKARSAGLLVAFALSFAAIITPWIARNATVTGEAVLSGGTYGSEALMHRVTYNRMSWAEWGVSFIYWFPDFGDNLAKALFPQRYYKKLGWNDDGYYREAVTRTFTGTGQTRIDKNTPVGEIVRSEVLSQPVKHTAVTLALAWRGMFINNYWGIIAWIAAAIVLARALRDRHYPILITFLPALFMLAFHAAVSVNIPRYNIFLIPSLSFAAAVMLSQILLRLRSRV